MSEPKQQKRVLVFTDSRGQHKPAGTSHDLFAERLAADPRLDVDLYLCPMKWTTTLDFLDSFSESDLKKYDHVILYTGIVEWSPRPASSAINDLYNNPEPQNADNLALNTRDYSKKIVNNKKKIFDKIFGAKAVKDHLNTPFEQEYEGEKTNNMYSLEMARSGLLPRLKKINNLIFVSANRFVPGWEGDFKRGRPKNIDITHEYSDLFAEELDQAGIPVVDLRAWDSDQIKSSTCDNIHLTEIGNNYIYDQLVEAMMLEQVAPLSQYLSPLVSVVVPIFNMKAWLVPCLESLAVQTLEQIEILLIDDGSTDNSADICAKFVTKDARFKYIYQENAGLGPARNTGVQHSTADYLTFVDSDDIVSMDYCEKLFSGLTSSEVEIVSCKFCRMDENGTLGEEQQNFLADVDIEIEGAALSDGEKILGLYSSSISCARLYKTTFLKTNGLKFPKRLPHEDWFFTYKAFLLAKAVRSVPEALYFWRIRGDSLSQTTRQSHVDSMFTLLQDTDDFLETISASPRVRFLANKRNLMLFVQLWNRSARAGKNIVEHYKERLPEHLKDISKRYATLEHHFLNKEYREQAARIIQIGSSLNVINSFVDHKTFNSVRKKLPKAHDDKAHRLLELKNAFKGERCFIIGNGPSLNLNNLDLLQGEFTFAVNSFFLKTRDTGFMPTFYVVEDNKVMEENAKDIREFDAPFKFFPEEYRRYDLEADTTCFFSLDQEFYMKSKPYYGIPRFSVSAHKEIFAGQTVTYANMQLAFYMGFTEVYLIGMDFNYHIPPEHKRTGNHILSTTDDPNHFHKDYFGKGKTWKDPQLDRVLLNYKMADLIYTAAQRKIYNATVGGKLEVFERVDYASLFTTKDSLSRTEKVQTGPQSISKAHELFNAGAFAECAQICDQLYQSRKLEMYRRFAQYARQHLEDS